MVLVIKAPFTTRWHPIQVCRDFIVISAVCGCQQESGITDYNHFARSKDRSSRNGLILADGSCRVRKGRNTNKEMKKKVLVTTCLFQKASSADLLKLIEPLLLHVKL